MSSYNCDKLPFFFRIRLHIFRGYPHLTTSLPSSFENWPVHKENPLNLAGHLNPDREHKRDTKPDICLNVVGEERFYCTSCKQNAKELPPGEEQDFDFFWGRDLMTLCDRKGAWKSKCSIIVHCNLTENNITKEEWLDLWFHVPCEFSKSYRLRTKVTR